MSERSDPICFRMNRQDYDKFTVYVDQTDLSQSKIAERAVREFLEENDSGLYSKAQEFASLALITGIPTAYAYIDKPLIALLLVAFISSAPFTIDYVRQFTDTLFSGIRRFRR